MAEDIAIVPSHERGKLRNPLLVAVWTFVTLLVYGAVYWYKANKELATLGRVRRIEGLGDSPVTSLIALTLGAFVIVPAVVTSYRGFQRLQRAQQALGLQPHSGWIALILWIVFFPGFLAYVADGMNDVLRLQAEEPPALTG